MPPVTGRTRNPRGHGAQLRVDIVRSAAALLDETGDAAAVTLRAVARQAGIAAPSIYAHFADREAILLAVVQEEFDALTAHLRGTADEGDPVAGLLAWCHAYLEYAAAHPQRYLVMFGGIWNAQRAMADDVIERADVAALGQAALADLGARLQACVTGGRSASTDPAADAMVLWVALHGLAHQRIVSTALPWPPGIADRLVRRLAYL
jgi:AcrR family transcriptional regulator